MDFQLKLDSLHSEIVSALCSIGELPEGLLPHYVHVEESDASYEYGHTEYYLYNLTAIHADGTCLLENTGTGIEEQRKLKEICIDSLAELWNTCGYLSGEATDTKVTCLLQTMEPIAKALITGSYITDFAVHDKNFICSTDAKTPFVWLVYKSGTHIHQADTKQGILNLKERLEYYDKYSDSDYCLYRYDGQKLFPVFPTVIHEWIDNQLKITNVH
jgi:hypothetical protein